MRHSGYYIILLLLTALSVSSYADNRQARKLIRKGNALYRADKRQEAQVDYLKAYRADSTDARVQYNLATSMFPQDYKLVQKELHSAQLYYDLGTYFGNCNKPGESNFLACIITAQNALKDYPYSSLREDFSLLLMKSKFELAENSVEAKKLERYQDAEDECYGFLNEFPESDKRSLAEKYIEKCKKYTSKAEKL